MNRMLEVEDLAFRIQLQEAVSSFSLSPNFTGFVLLVLSMLPIQTKTFLLFLRASLIPVLQLGRPLRSSGILRNAPGDVLKRSDLKEGRLAALLTPEDYNLKDQVST